MEGIKPIYEFLLWNNCKNNCAFCFQKARQEQYPGKFPDDLHKIESINLVYNFLKSDKFEKGSHVLFMGGEIFDCIPENEKNSRLTRKFNRLMVLVMEMMISGDIELLYLNTNLLYSQRYLITLLDNFYAYDLIKRIRFTTSYDFQYRFKTSYNENMMLNHASFLHEHYPELQMVANVILTEHACLSILDEGKDFNGHTQLGRVSKALKGIKLIFIPYITLHKQMSPSRELVHRTLCFLERRKPGFLKRYVDNLALPQPKYLWEYNGGKLEYVTSPDAECGHNVNFRKVYKDDDRCFICDCIKLLETVGE